MLKMKMSFKIYRYWERREIMKYRKLIKQLNNYQLFRILMKRRDKTVKIKVKTKALVSVLLSFVMIMGLLFVPQVYAEDQPDRH